MTHTNRQRLTSTTWLVLLATLSSALYLFGCNSSTSSSGNEYIGVWENPNLKGADVLNITREGDHFLIKKTWGSQVTTYPATLENGILYIADGSHQPYAYLKAADTLITPAIMGNKEYHRK